MSDVVYTSRVRVERLGGPNRRAYVPAREDPVLFGVHSDIAEHYCRDMTRWQPTTTTIDYLVAALAG
jgi:hypothetical protein